MKVQVIPLGSTIPHQASPRQTRRLDQRVAWKVPSGIVVAMGRWDSYTTICNSSYSYCWKICPPVLFTWSLSYFPFFHCWIHLFAPLEPPFLQPVCSLMNKLLLITSSPLVPILIHLYPNLLVLISVPKQFQFCLVLPTQLPNWGWPCKTNSPTDAWFTPVTCGLHALWDKSPSLSLDTTTRFQVSTSTTHKHIEKRDSSLFFQTVSIHMRHPAVS